MVPNIWGAGPIILHLKWGLLYITGYLNSVVASWLKLPAFYLPDELRGVGVLATATVGKTSTVSDAEKNGENKFECTSRSNLMSCRKWRI